ncbi:aspartyl/asparaginyl beta-hydroxylase domain-containing protein [Massilia sp. IC2-476]|uniref:aspartyl/asparaginyl beta-hydroxylase domain-containing protein n=1 Tax=Massilia sp. IC2-476 TaxID=2887199 RepID=UPI001D1294E8|nr:aspartyl/asparaginyl beta-hydroxylase domain-containing protein [Massilia sp. IC2-476]MCC2974949.1 aspartyl/asparaginyl beta-hydroxylase domain-containing protein [Massilia sp. IC2-476]
MQQADLQQIAALEREAQQASSRGDARRAGQLWQSILGRAPDHPRALRSLSHLAFQGGDLAQARKLLDRLVTVDGREVQQWLNLSVVCLAMGDEASEEAAIRGALTIDPYDLVALVLRSRLCIRQGRRQEAAGACAAVAAVAPPLHTIAPDLQPAVREALDWHEAYQREFGAFLDDYLTPFYRELGGEHGSRELRRFRESVDVMTGRKRRYDPQPQLFHYLGLAPTAFFEREDFPWLDEFEAATGAIRDELLGVMTGQDGFTPYINYSDDQPLAQWAQLNRNLDWSAFRLIDNGGPVEENAARCPRTMDLLARAPQPDQPGRTPSAMFSILKPRTRIPPHTGVSNVRLVTHLPLVVPPGCGFRVGNEVREWEVGKAWVFDDTIEHEAWNDSGELRAVLIFDIWHPHLSAAERAMITAMAAGINAFTKTGGGYGL